MNVSQVLDQYFRESERGICDTGRYRCPYYVWGNGPALVFIPGLCDDALSFVLPISLLKNHFRCVAFDLPSGKADAARLGSYRHGDYVADLVALTDHLALPEANLFGSSFGSTIALRALAEYPARFPKGILQGGFARRPIAWAEIMLASWARYWRGSMGVLPFRGAIMKSSHEPPFRHREPAFWNFMVQRTGASPMAAVAWRALALHRVDLRPHLAKIQQPVLLICGQADPLVGKGCEKDLLEGLPHACRVELERCGHLPQYSHPEEVAELVDRFLTSCAQDDLS